MIKVACFTNIDDYKREEWPQVFCCVPVVGNSVVSKAGKVLKIVQISHCIDRISHPDHHDRPYLRIDLHR